MASTSSIRTGSNLTSDPLASENQNKDSLSRENRNQERRGRRDGRNRGNWRGRGRGGGRNGQKPDRNAEQDAAAAEGAPSKSKKPQPPRPTHFLALPLHNHHPLSTKMTAFHNALFHPTDLDEPLFSARPPATTTPSSQSSKNPQNRRPPPKPSSLVEGLDTSIVIDPVRMHMTLGVMALELDEDPPREGGSTEDRMSTGPDFVAVKEDATLSSVGAESGLFSPLLTQKTAPTSTTIDDAKSRISTTRDQVDIITSSTTAFASASEPLLIPPKPPRTISTALALLSSLKPAISEILGGTKGVRVPLESLDVLKTQPLRLTKGKAKETAVDAGGGHGRKEIKEELGGANLQSVPRGNELGDGKMGAGVLFVGPSELNGVVEDEDRDKLKLVTDLVHKTFRKHGYITENRPLKLHCSILNASHRRPPRNRGQPFSYSDILALEPALRILGADPPPIPSNHPENADNATIIVGAVGSSRAARSGPESLAHPSLMGEGEEGATQLPGSDALLDLEGESRSSPRKSRTPGRTVTVPPPLPINLGTYHVNTIELWKMGSFGPDGGYVSCGGIELA